MNKYKKINKQGMKVQLFFKANISNLKTKNNKKRN